MRYAIAIGILAALGLGIYALYQAARKKRQQMLVNIAGQNPGFLAARNRVLQQSFAAGGGSTVAPPRTTIDPIDPGLISGDFEVGVGGSRIFDA